ncbi:MAG: pyridoxal-phosphate dependent enzyme [Proteobacteria bacterium]|nr:pyridoxal-phosphate dependent enzyme [Pseudomonadota bacterium]
MNPIRSIIAIALSTLATSPLFAQLAPAKPAGGAVGGAMPAAAQSTTSAPPAQRDIDPKAKAIYDKAVSATKAAKTLTFTAELTMASNGPDTKAMMPAGIEGKTRFTVRFVDAKVPATAPAGGLSPLPSDSICVERLDGPNKGSVLVIHGGRVLRIDNARKTFSEGGAEHAMLAMMAMRMYPEWIHTFRESSNANEGQPEPISITLDGTKQVDGLECDVIKVVRQMQMVMGGVVMDGDDGAEGGDAGKSAVAPDVKTPETNPTVMSTETIVIARADGLPRQQTIKLVMAPPPGDAGEGMVIDGPEAGRITEITARTSLADGLTGNLEPGTMTFPLVKKVVDYVVTISEDDLTRAMRGLAGEEHLIVEGAGAAATAAVMAGKASAPGQRVVVLVTGGNVDLPKWLFTIS